MRKHRPRVGLLYNPTTPQLLDYGPALVEHLSVMPDRLWFDFGTEPMRGRRFHRLHEAIDRVKRDTVGRMLAGRAFPPRPKPGRRERLVLPSAVEFHTFLS